MNISNTPGAVKKFGRTPWRFQTTFGTPPVEELDAFVSTIISANELLESGTVTIVSIVFDTENLNTVLDGHLQSGDIRRESSFMAESKGEVKKLLIAAFFDGNDFLFVPTPKPFVIYVDHDDFTTFYANKKSNLNSVVQPLLDKGFRQMLDYQRQL